MSRLPRASDIIGKKIRTVLRTPSETGDGTPFDKSSSQEFFRVALEFEDSMIIEIGLSYDLDPLRVVEVKEFLGAPNREFTKVFGGSSVVNVYRDPISGEMFVLCDNDVVATFTLEEYGTVFCYSDQKDFEKFFGFPFSEMIPLEFEP
jgi:hypothetical protein